MSRLNHVYRTAGLAAIGVLALAGCGAGGLERLGRLFLGDVDLQEGRLG